MTVVASAARRARYWLTVSPPISASPGRKRRQLVDFLMDRFVEMPRLEKVRNAIQGFVVDEDGAQQRLLGLDIVRGDPVERRLIRCELARG
jgi:hypothetical protein